MISPTKSTLIDAVRQQLSREFQSLEQAAKAAHDAATHEESRAEDAHDTRSIEAGYLAGAQLARVEELRGMLEFYSRYEPRTFSGTDPIAPGALVTLEDDQGKRSRFFLVSQGGGLLVRLGSESIQLITPKSPMGEELLDRRCGESFEIDQRGAIREFVILEVS